MILQDLFQMTHTYFKISIDIHIVCCSFPGQAGVHGASGRRVAHRVEAKASGQGHENVQQTATPAVSVWGGARRRLSVTSSRVRVSEHVHILMYSES